MRFHLMTRHVLVLPAIVAGMGLLLTACGGSSGQPSSGSSGSPTSSPASSSTSSSGSPGSAGAAASTIKTNWEAFFSASTPTAKRVSLLQNGSQFASLIAAQAKSSLASSASAKVNS